MMRMGAVSKLPMWGLSLQIDGLGRCRFSAAQVTEVAERLQHEGRKLEGTECLGFGRGAS
jgi:hypothetical protein